MKFILTLLTFIALLANPASAGISFPGETIDEWHGFKRHKFEVDQVIHKPGVGHHPHGLDDPKPVVDFIVKHARSRK